MNDQFHQETLDMNEHGKEFKVFTSQDEAFERCAGKSKSDWWDFETSRCLKNTAVLNTISTSAFFPLIRTHVNMQHICIMPV